MGCRDAQCFLRILGVLIIGQQTQPNKLTLFISLKYLLLSALCFEHMHMMIQRSMRLKSTFIPVVACGRHRDTIARALSVLWEVSITWTLCVIDRGWTRPQHQSWTPCGGGSAGSGMGDANVDRGWAGRSHRSWIPAAAVARGRGAGRGLLRLLLRNRAATPSVSPALPAACLPLHRAILPPALT